MDFSQIQLNPPLVTGQRKFLSFSPVSGRDWRGTLGEIQGKKMPQMEKKEEFSLAPH